jgi:hypothetical protein
MAEVSYTVVGDHVLAALDTWPLPDLADFIGLLEQLKRDPYPGGDAGVLRFTEPGARLTNAFTAPFDRAILLFQVMADYPVIRLVQVTRL